MSGVQGPLETRTKTTVETSSALEGLDATPFDSGESAYVRATGQTYELSREDVSNPDGFNVLSVGPTGSVGRWLRKTSSAGGTGPTGATGITGPTGPATSSSTIASNRLNADTTFNDANFTPFMNLNFVIPGGAVGDLLILATVNGHTTQVGGVANFAIGLDGEGVPTSPPNSFTIEGDTETTSGGSSYVRLTVAPGIHSVHLYEKTNGIPFTIDAIAAPSAESAELTVLLVR